MHLNAGDCQVLPATAFIDYKDQMMDVDRNLAYLKISCSSVLEAKKRALVLAYLTYDMTRHIFVKLNTSQMLANPYELQNIYEVHSLYNLSLFRDPVNVDQTLQLQKSQPH